MTKISNQYSLTNILTADLANSRLGINNVSPAYALDVTGAGKFSSSVTATGVNGAVKLTLQNSDNAGYLAFTEQDIRMWRPNGSGADLSIATQAISGSLGSGAIIFQPANTERMRINSSGTLLMPSNQIGANFQASTLVLQGYNTNNSWISENIIYTNNTGLFQRIAAGVGQQIYFDFNGQILFSTWNSGSAGSATGKTSGPYLTNGGTSWTNGSDVRKKKNFETTQGLAEVLQIEPIKYNLKSDEDGKPKRLGFKAQNLQTLIPEMVIETPEKAEDGSSYLAVTHDYILPVLVKAIQELSAENTSLINRIEALENK